MHMLAKNERNILISVQYLIIVRLMIIYPSLIAKLFTLKSQQLCTYLHVGVNMYAVTVVKFNKVKRKQTTKRRIFWRKLTDNNE